MSAEKTIGVLMLATNFPRLPGDIGHPGSFNYPVIYQRVEQATPATIVTDEALTESIQSAFEQAAQLLVNENVSLITTSCGFLSSMQTRLSEQCKVPVLTSTLTLLPVLTQLHGGVDRLGILTYDRSKLNTRHLGNLAPTAIEGLTAGDSLHNTISNDLPELDRVQALRETLDIADKLLTRNAGLTAIVLECTNLSPYKQDLRTHTGLPVYDIVDAIHWLMGCLPKQCTR